VEKINKLWNNPKLCREMGENAREYVENNFGSEKHNEKLMKIYKIAIERHKM
jgi:glycosyltransferase involved in cell wall biosynthesis